MQCTAELLKQLLFSAFSKNTMSNRRGRRARRGTRKSRRKRKRVRRKGGQTCLLGSFTASQVYKVELGRDDISRGPLRGVLLQSQAEDGM